MTAQDDDKRKQDEREAERPKLDKETLKDLDAGPAADEVAGGKPKGPHPPSEWQMTVYEDC